MAVSPVGLVTLGHNEERYGDEAAFVTTGPSPCYTPHYTPCCTPHYTQQYTASVTIVTHYTPYDASHYTTYYCLKLDEKLPLLLLYYITLQMTRHNTLHITIE